MNYDTLKPIYYKLNSTNLIDSSIEDVFNRIKLAKKNYKNQILKDKQIINNNNYKPSINNIHYENQYIYNNNILRNPYNQYTTMKNIPLNIQKNGNKEIESITFEVEKGLKIDANLSQNDINHIFLELFSEKKPNLNKNEPKEILYYKLDTNEKEFYNFKKKSLIQGLVNAYRYHYPITVTPDMIWLLVLQGFSRFLDKYHELVRKKFVNFEGKKTIYINRSETSVRGATPEIWDGIINECVEKIGENIGKETITNLQADFTTTNDVISFASKASIMSSMKHYFQYRVLTIGCGISYITLEGSLNDWEKIKSKIKYLSKFGLDWWIKCLIPIIDKIIETKKYYDKKKEINNELADFWKKMIRIKETYKILPYDPDILNGWIIKFIPNLNEEQPKIYEEIRESDVPDEILHCPLKIIEIYPNQGYKILYDCSIASGFYGMIPDKKSFSVKPVIGYAYVVEKKEKSKLSQEDMAKIFENYFKK